jgi:predicted GNAT family N-acyltransferase
MEKLQAPLYQGVDILCRASTKEGAAFFDALGFSRGVWWDGEFREDFRHYRRSYAGAGDSEIAPRLRPPFDDHVPEAPRTEQPLITARVVHTLDEMLKVFAIRSAVYVEEQACPFGEEFDGNDFSGTHLLAMVGDEPAGCLRIRYFADFAKIERVAVLRRFRLRGVGKKLVTAASELCRAKGYRRLYAHARRGLLPFWAEQGFAEMGGIPFAFSDHEYVEITRELPPLPNALALAAGPYVLIRPEGQWDRPGVLEQSSARGIARRPAVLS